jgi:hypothetical protein
MKKWFIPMVVLMMFAGVQAAEKPAGMTKEKFIAMQQKRAEAAGREFNAKKAEAIFAKKDANKDGVLSKKELAAGKGKKEGGAKKKAAADSEE